MSTDIKNYPFAEIEKAVTYLTEHGIKCFQKFTCANCGNRLTIDEPNVFYTSGSCDKCGHVTDIQKDGCNYMAIASNMSISELNSLFARAGDLLKTEK